MGSVSFSNLVVYIYYINTYIKSNILDRLLRWSFSPASFVRPARGGLLGRRRGMAIAFELVFFPVPPRS